MLTHHQTITAVDLTKREREILVLIASDLSQKDIAGRLQLSGKTVNTYKTKAMRKLNAVTNLQLFRALVRLGFVRVD